MHFERNVTRPHLTPGLVLAALLTAAAVIATAPPSQAGELRVGTIEIDHPWSRATPAGAKVGAGYMTIRNTGNKPDRLIGGSTPIAGRVEVHEMKMEGGVMKMRKLVDGVEIAPGATLQLKPGGYHLMLMQLTAPIVEDRPFQATLRFARAGGIELTFEVEKIGAATSGRAGGHAHHGAKEAGTAGRSD